MLRHWFLAGLAAAAGLAFVVPELGVRGGPLRPELTTRVGVALIFFMQGVVIPPAALRTGALRWRVHLTTQLFIFLAFPACMILLVALGGRLLPADLRLGFLFLAILPTTISGCVVYTAAAGGNTAVAMFNSAAANIAGVAITPLWAALLLQVGGAAPPVGSMIGEVALLLLAPLLLGQGVRPVLLRGDERGPAFVTTIANWIIIFIVFTAFANAVSTDAFGRIGALDTVITAVAVAGVFVAATAAAAALGRRSGFDEGERIALLFCAPQKTLAAGAPMAQILFAGNPGLALILVPLLVYHAVQLLAGAVLVDRLRS
jgi:solute carrier family 10 (sodium/bile acid cotransporter), member 7